MDKIGLIFPHQLFLHHRLLSECNRIYLVEEFLFFSQYAFHKQKIAFHRATMKYYYELLRKKNISVSYINNQDAESDVRVLVKMISKQHRIETLHFIDPTDNWLSKRIRSTSEPLGLKLITYENPLFLNTTEELSGFFRRDKKSFFQTTFYKQQRVRLNILIEKDKSPVGGKWTFDDENRKKYPKQKTPPAIHFPHTDEYWHEAVDYVDKNFADNPGQLGDSPIYPSNHEDAEAWLLQFLELRFQYFGDYEDAIVKNEIYLHHSVLSPLINIGLLSPQDVLNKSLAYATKENVPINSLEGFVRQIIGWREFVRGIYECKGSFSRTKNYWNFSRKIPASFYSGTTGIEPVDQAIKKVLKTGYCHHIERLMILGNFMLLCEFDPDEVYRWFMELFIDAYDWVMVPNVYGMSQFADGGLFATKPYISGSNYVRKMTDYKTGDWQNTWDGLFWRFVQQHHQFFKQNPRISMLYHSFNRMPESKKTEHITNAEAFLAAL